MGSLGPVIVIVRVRMYGRRLPCLSLSILRMELSPKVCQGFTESVPDIVKEPLHVLII